MLENFVLDLSNNWRNEMFIDPTWFLVSLIVTIVVEWLVFYACFGENKDFFEISLVLVVANMITCVVGWVFLVIQFA